jgi:ferredoxin
VSYKVTITDTGEEYTCTEQQHLLAGMLQLGKKGIPVGCRGGGCGVCKIRILQGAYDTKKMSRDRVTEQEEKSGTVLACRVFPRSDIRLQVVGKLEAAITATNVSYSSIDREK